MYLTCSHSLSNRFNEPFLRRSFRLVDSKNVGQIATFLNHFFDNTGEVDYVNSGHSVATVANHGQFLGVLNPRLLEVIIEGALTIAVSDTTAHDMNFQKRLGRGRRHGDRFKRL